MITGFISLTEAIKIFEDLKIEFMQNTGMDMITFNDFHVIEEMPPQYLGISVEVAQDIKDKKIDVYYNHKDPSQFNDNETKSLSLKPYRRVDKLYINRTTDLIWHIVSGRVRIYGHSGDNNMRWIPSREIKAENFYNSYDYLNEYNPLFNYDALKSNYLPWYQVSVLFDQYMCFILKTFADVR